MVMNERLVQYHNPDNIRFFELEAIKRVPVPVYVQVRFKGGIRFHIHEVTRLFHAEKIIQESGEVNGSYDISNDPPESHDPRVKMARSKVARITLTDYLPTRYSIVISEIDRVIAARSLHEEFFGKNNAVEHYNNRIGEIQRDLDLTKSVMKACGVPVPSRT